MNFNFFHKKKSIYKKITFFIAIILQFSLINLPFYAVAESINLRQNVLIRNQAQKQIAPGVTLTRYNEYVRTGTNAAGWSQYTVMTIDLKEPAISIDTYLANNVLTSPATLTNIVKANDLIAGINADFFDIGYSSAPLSTLIQSGNIIRTPRLDLDFSTLFLSNFSADFVNNLDINWSGTLIGEYGSPIIDISGYNDNNIPKNGSVIFDLSWPIGVHSGSWLNDSIATTIVTIDKEGYVSSVKKGPFKESDLIKKDYSVGIMIADANNKPITYVAKPYYELVARGNAAKLAERLYVGDHVKLSFEMTPSIDNIETAFSGKPMLVIDGEIAPNLARNYTTIQGNSRAPRSAVGLSKDKKVLFLVVVDGRTSNAIGMTLTELAELMSDLGCYNALNLDGGGSSSIVYDSSNSKYSLATRLSEAERRIPYAVGISYVDKASMAGIPSNIELSAYVRKDSSSPKISVNIPQQFDMAILGGTQAFANQEIILQNDYELIFEAKITDVFGNQVSLDENSEYNLKWDASGALQVSHEGENFILRSNKPGKIYVKAQILEKEPSEDILYSNLPCTSLNVRNAGETGFMKIDSVNRNVNKDSLIQINLVTYDEYGFKMTLLPKNLEISLISNEIITYLEDLNIPCDYFKSNETCSLVIKCDGMCLKSEIKVEGVSENSNDFEITHINITPLTLEKSGSTVSKNRFTEATIQNFGFNMLIIDVSKGGITETDLSMWQKLENYLSETSVNFEIVLTGGNVMSQDGTLEGFKDKSQAELFFNLLSSYSDPGIRNITLRQKGTVPGWMMIDGVKCIWEK